MKTRYQSAEIGPVMRGVLALGRVEPEKRIEPERRLAGSRIPGEQRNDADQHDHAPEIAHSPGDVGDSTDVLLADQEGHHRIVEDDRKLGGDRCERQEERRVDQRRTRHREPEHGERGDLDGGKKADPRLAGSGRIGDGTEDRRQHGYDDTGDRQRIAPDRLAGGVIRR
ncbi:hypothetical protein ABIA16_000094 [Sinorhizobium fredii]